MNAYAAARSGEFHPPVKSGEAPLPSAYDGDDPFLAHGMGSGGLGHIVGKIRKVPAGQNGEYSYRGRGDGDDTVIPRGGETLVAVDKLALRAVRWEGGKVAEQLIGFVAVAECFYMVQQIAECQRHGGNGVFVAHRLADFFWSRY